MPYAKLEPTGCGIHKGRIKLRLDFFLSPDDPNYDKHYVYVPVIPKEGYHGKIAEDGSSANQKNYDAWLESLPHVWQNTPFHSHFIYPDKDASDADIKAEIERCLKYLYAFHQYCWDENKKFIDEWKKVPSRKGQVRQPFVKGEAKDVKANKAKVQNIVKRAKSFQVGIAKVPPQDLNIGEKGTIDVGSAAISRASQTYLWYYTGYETKVEGANPANATGVIDTVEAWFKFATATNSVKYGTFEHLGSNVLKCHDAEEYGQVASGSKQTCTGLSIDISTGEYIGADARVGVYTSLAAGASGGTGKWGVAGQYCDPNDQTTFAWGAGHIMSLYGTGTEGGGEENHRRGSFFKMM